MSWTRLTLEVRTPLFSGEDSVGDGGALIRVPSIRGALRFWFRALAAGHGMSDLKRLWEAEEAVFGSTGKPSAIALRVPEQPTVSKHLKPDWTQDRFAGARYLLGQGLWDRDDGLRRSFVASGEDFSLEIRFSRDGQRDEQAKARFMLALWAWLTYGGLGARTRRGFGQLACTAVEGDLPVGWMLDHLLPPANTQRWRALGECAVPCSLPDPKALGWGELLPPPTPEGEPLPELPTLAPQWWKGVVLDKPADSLGEALHKVGLEWRRFRADKDRDKKFGQSACSPEWTNVICGNHDGYPIAAFGLPVGYFSKKTGFNPTVTPELAGVPLRRASPVWLRPVLIGENSWNVFTHLFYARLLPEDAELWIRQGEPQPLPPRLLPLPSDEVVEYGWDRWLARDPSRLPDNYFPKS